MFRYWLIADVFVDVGPCVYLRDLCGFAELCVCGVVWFLIVFVFGFALIVADVLILESCVRIVLFVDLF